jgi:hypothetical protein
MTDEGSRITQGSFDAFEETMANLASTAEILKAVVQMIEGARGLMIASACATRAPTVFPYAP